MVTSFYIMMMSNSKKTDLDAYYSSILHKSSRTRPGSKNKCRVCLREGHIPIYGNKKIQDLCEALVSFADIEISENDQYPNHLCKVCYRFIQNSISFRKRAKLTQELLKKPVKVETVNMQPSNEKTFCEIDWQNEDFNFEDIQPAAARLPPKVTCKVCNKVYDRKYYKHHISIHDPNHEKAHVCEICGKDFRLRSMYYTHRRLHQSDFPFKCNECPYRARQKHILKLHMATHTDEFKYVCTECPARFHFVSNLNIHVLKKHREPQLKCNMCEKKFHRQIAVKRHYEAEHLGLRNHVCNICGKAFGYRGAMMKHERGVHKREKLMSGITPAYIRAQIENQDQNASVSGSSQLLG